MPVAEDYLSELRGGNNDRTMIELYFHTNSMSLRAYCFDLLLPYVLSITYLLTQSFLVDKASISAIAIVFRSYFTLCFELADFHLRCEFFKGLIYLRQIIDRIVVKCHSFLESDCFLFMVSLLNMPMSITRITYMLHLVILKNLGFDQLFVFAFGYMANAL